MCTLAQLLVISMGLCRILPLGPTWICSPHQRMFPHGGFFLPFSPVSPIFRDLFTGNGISIYVLQGCTSPPSPFEITDGTMRCYSTNVSTIPTPLSSLPSQNVYIKFNDIVPYGWWPGRGMSSGAQKMGPETASVSEGVHIKLLYAPFPPHAVKHSFIALSRKTMGGWEESNFGSSAMQLRKKYVMRTMTAPSHHEGSQRTTPIG